jgi:hypothetical protein
MKMRLDVSFYYLVTTDVSFQSTLSPIPYNGGNRSNNALTYGFSHGRSGSLALQTT